MSLLSVLKRWVNPPIVVRRTDAAMLDLETMSLAPNAAVYAIGAVRFNIGEKANVESILNDLEIFETTEGSPVLRTADMFLGFINPSEYDGLQDFAVDEDTLRWTENNNKELFEQAKLRGGPIDMVVADFQQWLTYSSNHHSEIGLTASNSPTFDHVILDHLLRHCGVKPPKALHFRNQFDVRTVGHLRDEIGMSRYVRVPKGMSLHHPIHDCVLQIESVAGFCNTAERGYL